MVPQNRLIAWSAIVLVPFGIVASWNSTAMAASLLAAALFAFVVVLDAVLSRGRLDGLAVDLPEVVRLQRERPGEIELLFRNESKTLRAIRVGLSFPAEITPEQEDLSIELPAGVEISRTKWQCLPHKRGRYIIEGCHIEQASRLGFWALRGRVECRSELRVYPNLFDERKHVAALFLNRGHYGIHSQRVMGKGREFEKLREYSHGDSLQDVHWKASAKRGALVTKVFQVERTQEVYVLVDSSRLSAREDMLERSLTAALVLAVAAEQQGDLFGLVGFNDKVNQFVRAKGGKSHFDTCRDAIYTQHPKMVSPDFDELCAFLRTRLRKRALLVFLTALDDPLLAESFSHNMDLLCRQHLILVNMPKPPGADPLFGRTPPTNSAQLYERLGGHLHWHNLGELEKSLRRRGVRFHLLDKENLCSQVVTQYMGVKARQLI
ncbi:MAG TPA: DUF58 domain-containing protein [Chthoniobacteraceae bacterium]|nr:DUF58 domain-containing protein [Chthoniobacteraceae bacterium]